MVFRAGEHEVFALRAADIPRVQELFERCRDFFQLIEERWVGPGEAESFFHRQLPYQRTLLGVGAAGAPLRALIELVRDAPGAGDWCVGLLLIDHPQRRAGLGTQLVAALAEWALRQHGRRLTLVIQDANAPARAFWGRFGFEPYAHEPGAKKYAADAGRVAALAETLARAPRATPVLPPLPEVLRTQRLRLRPWAFTDVADVFGYASDAEWARFLPAPQPYVEADAQRFIAAQVLLDRRQHASWAIEHDGRAVGGVNVELVAKGRIAEIGYSVQRELWGRGLTTEAARAVITAAFQTRPALLRVQATCDARNLASARVMEKLGMQREGLLRASRYDRGEPVDVLWYAVLRGEWR